MKTLLLIFFFVSLSSYAQVGVNTDTPEQALDINGKIKIGDDATTPTEGTIRYNSVTEEFEGHNGFQYKSLSKVYDKNLSHIDASSNQLVTDVRGSWISIGVETTITDPGLYFFFFKCEFNNLIGNVTSAPSDVYISLALERESSTSTSFIDATNQEPLRDVGTSAVTYRWRKKQYISDFSSYPIYEETIVRLKVKVDDNGIGSLEESDYFVTEPELIAIKISD